MAAREALEASLSREARAAVIDLDPPYEWSSHQLLGLVNHLGTLLDEIDGAGTPQSLPILAVYLENLAALRSGDGAGTPHLPPILAVYLENSATAVAAVLAALRSGFSFLPLDPRWPQSRLIHIIEQFKPAALVCAAPGVPGATTAAPPAIPTGCTLLRLTADDIRAARAGNVFSGNVPKPSQRRPLSPIAYVLTTSGSSGGPPLGVLGTTAGVLARCRWAERAFPWRANDLVAFKTSLCFVDSVAEVLGPLLAGVPLLAIPYRISADPGALAAALIEHSATHMTAVPSVWARLVPHLQRQPSRLRLAVSSGQQLPWPLLAALRDALPSDCIILNLYGSTEVAGDCTAIDCTQLERSSSTAVPVGLPLPGALVALARINSDDSDDDNELLDPVSGAEGEIVVGGWGLAAGYVPPPPRRRRFVSVPLEAIKARCIRPEYPAGAEAWRWEEYVDTKGAVPLFRTGDRGRLDSQGHLCILGRLDLQIKVDGVRVDLEEVEAALGGHPAVRAAACRAWPRPGSLLMAAYVEWGDSDGDSDALKEFCAARLPAAAVPGSFQALEALPRSAAGKLDRSALPFPADHVLPAAKRQKTEPMSLSEVAVAAAFARALGHAGFEPTESIFACGGTSLTAVEIAHTLQIDVEEVFAAPTVRGLAAKASRATAVQPSDTEAEELGGGAEPAIVWRYKMADCVDMPPLCDAEQRWCWAASHGGTVACLNAATGTVRWQMSLAPEQPDPGLALLSNGTRCAVAANSGAICFLDAETGQRLEEAVHTVHIEGGLRSGPVIDPFGLDLVWVAGHGKTLAAVAPPPGAGIRAALALPSAVSAGLSFGLEAVNGPTVYVAGLDGTLLAVSIDPGPPLLLVPRWKFQCGAPIFGAPVVVNYDKSSPLVLVGTAAGEAVAVRGGEAVWRQALHAGPIFAAPVVLEGSKCAIIGTQGGVIVWLALEDGTELGRRRLPRGAAATALFSCRAGRGLTVTTADGHVLMFDALIPGSAPTAGRKLPSPTFAAAPGPRPGSVLAGCRDDHLYLIDFDEYITTMPNFLS